MLLAQRQKLAQRYIDFVGEATEDIAQVKVALGELATYASHASTTAPAKRAASDKLAADKKAAIKAAAATANVTLKTPPKPAGVAGALQ